MNHLRWRCAALLAVILLCGAGPVVAGSISFRLILADSRLRIVNTGDSTAFFPTVLKLNSDGRWLALSPLPPPLGQAIPSELAPGAQMDFVWPAQGPLAELPPLARTRPAMVRFFDQAGVGFGQISFFDPPPAAKLLLPAHYEHGLLNIVPPGDTKNYRASWILWPENAGIAPLSQPLRTDQPQPPAWHVVWRPGMAPLNINTGAGRPEVMLLHETAQGLVLQKVASGWAPGQQQRAAWLDAGAWFYGLGLMAAAAALFVLAASLLRRRTASGCAGSNGAILEPTIPWLRRWSPGVTRLPTGMPDLAVGLAAAALIANTLGVHFLNSRNWPTGGDSASHLLYAWLYAGGLLWHGHVLPWVPEVFGGLPFLSYYFPLPFIVIAVLAKILGLAPAFKWGAFLAAMLLPGAVFSGSRRLLKLSWPAAFFGALGALAFLLHEQNSIWGGNLLSSLSGEFAYSYGLLFAMLAMMAWSRAAYLGRGWLLAGLLEAASGFSHGFPLLVVGFSSAFLLLDGGAGWDFRRCRATFAMLWRGHLLAFCLLGGWLWPMLEMHRFTIPNDAAFVVSGWRDLLPATLWPMLAVGGLGALALGLPAVRRVWGGRQAQAARYFVGAAGVAALAFVAADQLGLADIRFFPMVWLPGAIVCGWLFGQALSAIAIPGDGAPRRRADVVSLLLCAAAGFAMLGWLGSQVKIAPDWALWNHSGLDSKPQWRILSKLFPEMRGTLWSPRLVFEHDPANNDIGSTRSLEALPMFLNHRPVMEGLYMESAVLGPAIYQLQSEVSAQPSSPLVRFPSGSLDPQFAAQHMNFLNADTLLLRSAQAKAEIEASGLFTKLAASPPFSLYHLKHFDSHLVQLIRRPLRQRPLNGWMQDAFLWFRTRTRFDAYLPYYGKALPPVHSTDLAARSKQDLVTEKLLSRHELIFETQAVGQPHLIKIAYNPRWQLVSKGSLRIAAPGFMLVVPEEREIHLVYGHTLVGKLGIAATIAAALCVLFFWLRPTSATANVAVEATAAPLWLRYLWLFFGWLLLAASTVVIAANSPERIYKHAWVAMNAHRYQDASKLFARAYDMRRPPAKKEEALFWLARSSEMAGLHAQAENSYLELCRHYYGYWVPESLYRAIELERRYGPAGQSAPLLARLREEYPNNRWTLKLASAKTS